MAFKQMALREARETIKRFRIIFAVTILVIFSGTMFYHFVEGWRWLDSLYFSIISLATVGYGDFTPQTDAGKIFTIFYLIFGIGIFAALLNNLLNSRFAKRSLKLYEEKEKQEQKK